MVYAMDLLPAHMYFMSAEMYGSHWWLQEGRLTDDDCSGIPE